MAHRQHSDVEVGRADGFDTCSRCVVVGDIKCKIFAHSVVRV